MHKINAIIIDDELHCLETLAWQLDRYCPEVNLIAQCLSAEEGRKVIIEQQPDLVFLDVEMPKMNGFQLLKSFERVDFGVIFTTAFDKFALQAFKVSAIDYLVKPIDDDQLKIAVQKALKGQTKDTAVSIEFLLAQIQNKTVSNRIFIPTLNGLEFIEKQHVIRCESDSNYTTLFLEGDKKMVVSKTLKNVEDLIPDPQFFRVHHSHLVNLDFVQKYVKGDGGHLVMKNGDVVPVSRGKKQELLDFLQA